MAIEELGAADLNSWKPVKPSSSPSATILSEKMILGLPKCDFGYRSDLNGQHELQKLWFVKWIDKTNEATWRIVSSYNWAQNQAWFESATLICIMKSTNYYPKVDTQTTGLAWIEYTLYFRASRTVITVLLSV